MRILVLVSGQKWLGGIAIQTALLCRELEYLGHQVVVVSVGAAAVVDHFRHEHIHHPTPDVAQRGGAPSGTILAGASAATGLVDGASHAGNVAGIPPAPGSDAYVFRYEVIADAARYLPPGSPMVRRVLSPLASLGMAIVAPPPENGGRAPLRQARGAAAAVARGLTAALDAGLSGGAADAPFLSRLLLRTDQRDLDRLNAIRAWFQPDVEYACDLVLVPMMARLADRGIPLVAAAQGFELVYRRGVGLLDALRAAKHRLDLVLSGSQANIEENLDELAGIADGTVPARAIPYGVALDGGWEMPREVAVRRIRDLETQLTVEQRGAGGLWGQESSVPGDGRPPFIVMCLSRIDVEKGTDLPLHALSILRRQGIPARLWIAGNAMPGSAYLDVLRQKIRLLDLQHCVSLIGTIRESEDKVALLRSSDAFAAGFIRSEPFGLVYTEAFASELPVVAPATGAAPEIMAHVGDTSTLYPPNDTGALAARLAHLYENQDARSRLARLEHQTFLTRYNAREMARAAADEFERAIKARGGRLHGT